MSSKPGRKTSVKTVKALTALRRRSVFTLEIAKRAGLSQPSITRLVQRGILVRAAPGLYQVSDSDFDPTTFDYVIATKLFGDRAVVGGLTALFHYGLIEEVPEQVWLLVPPSVRNTKKLYRIIRTSRSLSVGILSKEGYRMVSIERAIVDAFIFGAKVGHSRGLACAVRALREKKTTEKKIFDLAHRMGVLEKVAHEWSAVAVALER